MRVKVGQRYRAPNDCSCEKCGKLDVVVIDTDNPKLKYPDIKLKCCSCGDFEFIREDEMFIDEFYTLITMGKLIKERILAPFESR